MKPIVIISFTAGGSRLSEKLCNILLQNDCACSSYTMKRFADGDTASDKALHTLPENISTWIGEQWGSVSFVFIGAIGIAVRYAAPWMQDKYKDSGVVVIDEKGQFVIPLLSGHLGGAVDLAKQLAEYIGGTPVITTATDIQNKFAVDVFARDNCLYITNRVLAKKISAALLEGEEIGIYSEFDMKGSSPKGVVQCNSIEELTQFGYGVAVVKRTNIVPPTVLLLLSRNLIVGVGCKKGISERQIEEELSKVLEELQVVKEQICLLASIDVKKDEIGMAELAKKLQVPFITYTAEELKHIKKISSHSAFVEKTVGIDNVCERAAIFAGDGGILLQPKKCMKEVTAAVVQKERKLYFKKENILLFAGTTEGRKTAEHIIKQKYPVQLYICTATKYGKECIGQYPSNKAVQILAQRMNEQEMEVFMEEHEIDMVIDATHPFAQEVTENIMKASKHQEILCLRLLRESGSKAKEVIHVDTVADAVRYLKEREGNIFISTGSKELEEYTHIPDYKNRCYVRVLSTIESIEKSIDLGFEGAHLFAMQGPYSKILNYGMLEKTKAAYFVTKESGKAGGFEEKVMAARETRAVLIVIGRPSETGMSEKEIYGYLQRRYTC